MDFEVRPEMEAMLLDIVASFPRIHPFIGSVAGYPQVRKLYVKHLKGPVWEMRMMGEDGIARVAYVAATGRRVVVVHVFSEEDAEDAASLAASCA